MDQLDQMKLISHPKYVQHSFNHNAICKMNIKESLQLLVVGEILKFKLTAMNSLKNNDGCVHYH